MKLIPFVVIALSGVLGFEAQGGARRLEPADFGITGSTTEEVCRSLIENFYVSELVLQFKIECVCNRVQDGGYFVNCVDGCNYCLAGGCARHSATFLLNEEAQVIQSEICDQFTEEHYGGVMVCLDENYLTTPSTQTYYVDGDACRSTTFAECPNVSGLGGALVDCSNLGYGSEMNFCLDGTTSGPFEILQAAFKKSGEYSVGTCDVTEDEDAEPIAPPETSITYSESSSMRSCMSAVAVVLSLGLVLFS